MTPRGPHLSGISLGAGLALLALGLGVGCTPPPALDAVPAKTRTVSLYERLGGLPAITAVVDDYIERLKKDPVVEDRFEALNVPRFRAKPIEQVTPNCPWTWQTASLVVLADHLGQGRIWSTDTRDFRTYRWKQRRPFENLLLSRQS